MDGYNYSGVNLMERIVMVVVCEVPVVVWWG